MLTSSITWLQLSTLALSARLLRLLPRHDAPVVKTINGTYSGKYIPAYNQDAFLGIPYAQPPTGDFRFRRPVSLNSSWDGTREAKRYGFTCYQNSNKTDMSEDCLFVNGRVVQSTRSFSSFDTETDAYAVFRPAGTSNKTTGLPIFVM
jgi:hypothetical protein